MKTFILITAAFAATGLNAQETFPVSIRVDAAKPIGELKPIWRFFGADEPNYATMKDGKKLLGELGELKPGEVFFRAHSLLVTGDGTPSFHAKGQPRFEDGHVVMGIANQLRDIDSGF